MLASISWPNWPRYGRYFAGAWGWRHMSPARVAAVGGGATFVLAAVVGVLGNQLAADAVWAWVAFVAAMIVGAVVTAWVAHHAATDQPGSSGGGVRNRVGDVSARDHGQATGINYGTVTGDRSVGDDPA